MKMVKVSEAKERRFENVSVTVFVVQAVKKVAGKVGPGPGGPGPGGPAKKMAAKKVVKKVVPQQEEEEVKSLKTKESS